MKTRVQTLILAQDEAAHIARAIRSALPLGSVCVIDGGSTDETVRIAEAAGARVIAHVWPGFAAQRRFALEQADAEWALFLDADEEISSELAREITACDFGAAGYYLRRRSLFLGRWMRHGAWGRDRVLRLVRRDLASVPERAVHEEVVVGGSTATFEHVAWHYAQNDFATIGRKFTAYVPLMAAEILTRRGEKRIGLIEMIARAKLSFIRDYFFRQGFRDGWQGFVLAFWGAASVVAKYAEARRLQSPCPPPC